MGKRSVVAGVRWGEDVNIKVQHKGIWEGAGTTLSAGVMVVT